VNVLTSGMNTFFATVNIPLNDFNDLANIIKNIIINAKIRLKDSIYLLFHDQIITYLIVTHSLSKIMIQTLNLNLIQYQNPICFLLNLSKLSEFQPNISSDFFLKLQGISIFHLNLFFFSI
jgi:hypothetical protein